MEKKDIIKFNILAILCIIIFAFAVSPVILQNDTFYTISIGKHIVENGLTPEDPFSWHEGLEYRYPHWVYDVLMYFIYNIGGDVGIYLSTVAFAAMLGLAIYVTTLKLSKNQLVAFITVLLSMFLLKPFIAARAQLITFTLFVLTIYNIEQFLETGRKRNAVALLIIPIIIANVHSAVFPFYFVLYLPYVGEYIIALLSNTNMIYYNHKIKKYQEMISNESDLKEEELHQLLKNEEEYYTNKLEKRKEAIAHPQNYKIILKKEKNMKWLLIIAVLCIFTGFLTPIGDMPYTYVIRIAQGTTTQSINEHLPLTLASEKEYASVIIVALLIYIFTPVKLRLQHWFLLGGLITLSFITRRQISMVYIMGIMIIAKSIADLIEIYDKEGTKQVLDYVKQSYGWLSVLALILILTMSMIKPKLNLSFIPQSVYPVKVADYMLENLDVKNIKIYNDYNYGSYLLFRGIPVFIDSRCDLYTPQFNKGRDIFSDFINISNNYVDYDAKFKEYGIQYAVVYKSSKLTSLMNNNKNYKTLFSDDWFVLFERLDDDATNENTTDENVTNKEEVNQEEITND